MHGYLGVRLTVTVHASLSGYTHFQGACATCKWGHVVIRNSYLFYLAEFHTEKFKEGFPDTSARVQVTLIHI